jgi:hypothetical protein
MPQSPGYRRVDALMAQKPPEKCGDNRCAEDDAECRARQVRPRRHPGKPSVKRLKLFFDDRKIGAGLPI